MREPSSRRYPPNSSNPAPSSPCSSAVVAATTVTSNRSRVGSAATVVPAADTVIAGATMDLLDNDDDSDGRQQLVVALVVLADDNDPSEPKNTTFPTYQVPTTQQMSATIKTRDGEMEMRDSAPLVLVQQNDDVEGATPATELAAGAADAFAAAAAVATSAGDSAIVISAASTIVTTRMTSPGPRAGPRYTLSAEEDANAARAAIGATPVISGSSCYLPGNSNLRMQSVTDNCLLNSVTVPKIQRNVAHNNLYNNDNIINNTIDNIVIKDDNDKYVAHNDEPSYNIDGEDAMNDMMNADDTTTTTIDDKLDDKMSGALNNKQTTTQQQQLNKHELNNTNGTEYRRYTLNHDENIPRNNTMIRDNRKSDYYINATHTSGDKPPRNVHSNKIGVITCPVLPLRLRGGGESSISAAGTGWGAPPPSQGGGQSGQGQQGQGASSQQSGQQQQQQQQSSGAAGQGSVGAGGNNNQSGTGGWGPPGSGTGANQASGWNNNPGQGRPGVGSAQQDANKVNSNQSTTNQQSGGNNPPSGWGPSGGQGATSKPPASGNPGTNGNGASAAANNNANAANIGGANATTKQQLEQLNNMREAILSQDGWGGQNVNQDTNWDIPGSPEPPMKVDGSGGGNPMVGGPVGPGGPPGGGMPVGTGGGGSGVPPWKPTVNNGTELWEANLRNGGQPPPVVQQKTPWGHTPATNIGGTWGEDDDVLPDTNNVWTGVPGGGGGGGMNPNNQQQQQQQQQQHAAHAVHAAHAAAQAAQAAAAAAAAHVVQHQWSAQGGGGGGGPMGGGGGGAGGGGWGNGTGVGQVKKDNDWGLGVSGGGNNSGWGNDPIGRGGNDPMGRGGGGGGGDPRLSTMDMVGRSEMGRGDMRGGDPMGRMTMGGGDPMREQMRAASGVGGMGGVSDMRDPRVGGSSFGPGGVTGRLNGTSSDFWGPGGMGGGDGRGGPQSSAVAAAAAAAAASAAAAAQHGGHMGGGNHHPGSGGGGGGGKMGPGGWDDASPPSQRRNPPNYDDGTSLWGNPQQGSHWKDLPTGAGAGGPGGPVGPRGGGGAGGGNGPNGMNNNVGPPGMPPNAAAAALAATAAAAQAAVRAGMGGVGKPGGGNGLPGLGNDVSVWRNGSSNLTASNSNMNSNWDDNNMSGGNAGNVGGGGGGGGGWGATSATDEWQKQKSQVGIGGNQMWGGNVGAAVDVDMMDGWGGGQKGPGGPPKGLPQQGGGQQPTKEMVWNSKQFRMLVDMGYKKDDVESALRLHSMSYDDALDMLAGLRSNNMDGWRGGGGGGGGGGGRIIVDDHYGDHHQFPQRFPQSHSSQMNFPPGNNGPMGGMSSNNLSSNNLMGGSGGGGNQSSLMAQQNNAIMQKMLAAQNAGSGNGGNSAFGNAGPTARQLQQQQQQQQQQQAAAAAAAAAAQVAVQQAQAAQVAQQQAQQAAQAAQAQSQPSTAQLRMLVQQIQMAVQAGYLNHQILNQPLAPQTLVLLNQLLQQIKSLQNYNNQQSSMSMHSQCMSVGNSNSVNAPGGGGGGNKPPQSTAYLQVSVMITKTKQQITNLQNQIAAQQAIYVKQHNLSGVGAGGSGLGGGGGGGAGDIFGGGKSSGGGGGGMHDSAISALQGGFSELMLKDTQMSRLTQWKLPPEKDDGGDFNRTPGSFSKPLATSHSSPINPLGLSHPDGDFNYSPWSSGGVRGSSADGGGWPDATSSSNQGGSSNDVDVGVKDWPSANQQPNLTDLVSEFEPGKPWKGNQLKSIEDDPSITPGSVVRSPLSLALKDTEQLFMPSSNVSSNKSPPTGGGGGGSGGPGALGGVNSDVIQPLPLSSSTWSFNPPSSTTSAYTTSAQTSSLGKQLLSSQLKQPSSLADQLNNPAPASSVSSELWGNSGNKPRGPPPGLGASGGKIVNGWAASGGGPGGPSAAGNGAVWASAAAAQGRVGGWSQGGSTGAGSQWLLLRNLTAQIDGSTLRTLCMQHGPLLSFHLYLHQGFALAKYSTREEAIKAQGALNNCVLGNTTILAENPSDWEANALLQQVANAGAGPGGAGGGSVVGGGWRSTPAAAAGAKPSISGGGGGGAGDTWSSGSTGGWSNAPSTTSSLWSSGGSLVDGPDAARNTPSSISSFLPNDLLGETM